MRTLGIVLAGALVMSIACGPAHKSSSGFRLPDGDAEAGRKVFVEMRCYACHTTATIGMPSPVADPPVSVRLGGAIPHTRTDGELLTSIVNPSHRIASGYDRELIMSGNGSRMADYGDILTVRQLADLVAFLHSQYEVVPPAQGP